MPYDLEKTPQGVYVVTDTGKRKNKEPLSEAEAEKYMAALYAAEGKSTKESIMQIEDWAITLKDDVQDGIMIALAIPMATAEMIALDPEALPEGAEATPPDQLHVTLSYLGTIQEADFTARDLMPVLSMLAIRTKPITGTLNGYGKFVTSHKDGLQVCYLNFDSPALPGLHHELLEALGALGLEFEVNHGFTPHVTLAYVPEGEEIDNDTLPALPIQVTFDRFILAYGENWYEFYFSAPENVGMDKPAPGATFPDNAKIPEVYSVKEEEMSDEDLESFHFVETTEKHLIGQHNQKRHGWSYGGGIQGAKRSMRGQSKEENAEYKKRARERKAKTPEYGPYHKDSEMGKTLFSKGRGGEPMELRSWDGKLDVDAKIINGHGFPMGLAVKFPHEKKFRKDRIMSKSDIEDYLSQFRPRSETSQKEFVIDQVLSLFTEKGNPHHAEDGKFASKPGGGGGGKAKTRADGKNKGETRGGETNADASGRKAPGNLQAVGKGEKPPKKTRVGGVTVTGSGSDKVMSGDSFSWYKGKVNGKNAYTFDNGKTWATNKLDALISAAGGAEAARPLLEWHPAKKEITLTRLFSALTGLFTKNPVMTGQGPAFFTVKEKNGGYRWVSFSSNPYLDRDRQMVSLKALENDVRRADTTGEYGPLLWWHTGAKLGDCDYNAMVGKILVESGTFLNPEIGAAVSQKADQLQVSIGMLHPLTEPDSSGVFHNIKRYERSILPAGRASNPLTAFSVKESVIMSTLDTQKEAQLIAMLGKDLASQVISQAGRVEKQAQDLGFAFAEKAAPEADMEEEEDMMEEEETPMPPAKKKTKALATVGEMPADQFANLIAGAVTSSVKEALAPLATAFTTLTQKDAANANAQEAHIKALKELGEKVQAQEQALEATKKELTGKMAALTGDLPPALAALAAYRPSQAESNITEKGKIPNQPAPDPMGDFMKFAAPYANGQ